jgi:hypothetical protein
MNSFFLEKRAQCHFCLFYSHLTSTPTSNRRAHSRMPFRVSTSETISPSCACAFSAERADFSETRNKPPRELFFLGEASSVPYCLFYSHLTSTPTSNRRSHSRIAFSRLHKRDHFTELRMRIPPSAALSCVSCGIVLATRPGRQTSRAGGVRCLGRRYYSAERADFSQTRNKPPHEFFFLGEASSAPFCLFYSHLTSTPTSNRRAHSRIAFSRLHKRDHFTELRMRIPPSAALSCVSCGIVLATRPGRQTSRAGGVRYYSAERADFS